MQFDSIERFEAWREARRFVVALTAITKTAPLCNDLELRCQIDDCADSILANMAEGFEQGSDRAFARYLVIAKGSCGEARTHLSVAQIRGYLPADTVSRFKKDAEQVIRMLAGLITYLLRCDRRRRR